MMDGGKNYLHIARHAITVTVGGAGLRLSRSDRSLCCGCSKVVVLLLEIHVEVLSRLRSRPSMRQWSILLTYTRLVRREQSVAHTF